jgi:isoleucyl-tRNA synthetase
MAKPGKKPPNKYEATINLRETAMPARGDLANREPQLLAEWKAKRIYHRIQEARAGAPLFVLHDGPPYSNGHIHYGHVLNKILKDIVVKAKTIAGFRAPYVPGWDTHGLPIELAVERELADRRAGMSQAEVRAACEAYARKFVAIQRDEFERLGVFGLWEDPYLTLEPAYERAIIRALAAFTRGGWLYRGKKPVYWCSRDKTALAEAEIEYQDKTSPSIHVRCPAIDVDPARLDARLAGKRLAFPIWTTTPWTLPANLAIVLGPHIEYAVVPNPKDAGEVLIVARDLVASFAQAIGADAAAAIDVDKAAVRGLEGARYQHPFLPDPGPDSPHFRIWFADYVTVEQGTGLVHTAPGHGADDYKTGVAHGLPAYAPVDDAGRFTAEVPHWAGMATDDANPKIVQHLADTGFLLNKVGDKVHHSYPHCWRCKGPILFRATPQWFVAMDHQDLRKRALEEIDRTTWVPAWGRNRIYAMIEARPDWVLSRQRLWGTPIPAFYCKGCGAEHVSAETMEHVAELFGREGANAWWTHPVTELVPAGTRCGQCGAGAESFEREKDIVDVWFESGVSWLAMREHTAGDHSHDDIDLYLEGSDQHRGWFHSALLTAVGVQGRAPYKQVITHGFVLDDQGAPYSKSAIEEAKRQGKKVEYVPPVDVIKSGGAEMFRLWAASTEFRTDIPYSKAILDGLSEWYRKFRNSARFLLSNLLDFDPDAPVALVTQLDTMMMRRVDDLLWRSRRAYDAYELHIVHRNLVEFVTTELSALYCDVVKDRLYSEAPASPLRRSAQAVLYAALRAITVLASPILCFTAEDIWKHAPRRKGDPDSVHLALLDAGAEWADDDPLRAAYVRLRAWRDRVNSELESFRAAKHKSVDARVTLRPGDPADAAALRAAQGELAEWFIVSAVELAGDAGPEVSVAEHGGRRCERCWKWYAALAAEPDDVCQRCAGALQEVKP